MKLSIKNRFTGEIIIESDCGSIRDLVLEAIKKKLNLCGANLCGANLSGADLCGANLCGADLSGADLCGANLCGADLSGADLCGANLCGANLCGADLSGADLCGANLCGANLCGADLSGADLCGANLCGANLKNTKGAELVVARTRILSEGDLIGWKKCLKADGTYYCIVKLLIPQDAKRSHAFGRKCRAEFAKVLEVIGSEFGISSHDAVTQYRVGETVKCHEWCEDWQEECAGGIHFFITRIEAENY